MAYAKKIWKDYPDTTTPILAEDLNNIEDGIEANATILGSATSADLTKLHAITADATELNYVDGVTSAIQTQFNNLNTYSTNETNTGKKWINNKPIYRKVYSISVTGTSKTTDISSLNIDSVIKLDGISQGNPYSMNYYMSSSDYLRVFITSAKVLYVAGGSTYPTTPYTATVILEYTKTTD